MEFTKKESFVKQIILYLNNKNYTAALELSENFVKRFPNEMVAHFLLAKSAFWDQKYDVALREGRAAFNMSRGEDITPCALLLACVYYRLKRYAEGYEFLNSAELPDTEEVLQMKLFFSMALENLKDVEKHAEVLLRMHETATKKLLARFI
ncbi:MAG: hypothetical protein QXT45_01050 [Candidatus Bilamarchaeaceae archaeon]